MERLINAEQYQSAYDLGFANLAEREGDSSFDFYFGLAALESAHPNDAVFAFERVAATTRDPVLRERARLELARAYFLTNNLNASENLFNQVLASNPPQNVSQNIEAFLQLIDTRRQAQDTSFDFSVASSFGSDGNVNSATSDGLIDTPLIGQIELNQDGQETGDNFYNLAATMSYKRPFTRDTFVGATLNLNHLDNLDTDQFDLDTLRGEVSYNWGNQINRFKHGFSYSKVNLDQNGFQSAIGLNSSWQRAGSNGWYQSLSGSYSQLRYDTSSASPQNDLRDVDQWLVSAGLTKLTQLFTHSLNLYFADEATKLSGAAEHNGRFYAGAAYNGLYRMSNSHTPFVRVSIQDVEHDDNHPVFFNDTRSDFTETLMLGWIWQINRDFSVNAEASYTSNDSDIPLFEYSRLKYQAGFRYQF
ncbi:MAG: hypothetical protein WD772_10040 [Pseudohongiellaceae bacterium]